MNRLFTGGHRLHPQHLSKGSVVEAVQETFSSEQEWPLEYTSNKDQEKHSCLMVYIYAP
jgi:hypothetical protein